MFLFVESCVIIDLCEETEARVSYITFLVMTLHAVFLSEALLVLLKAQVVVDTVHFIGGIEIMAPAFSRFRGGFL